MAKAVSGLRADPSLNKVGGGLQSAALRLQGQDRKFKKLFLSSPNFEGSLPLKRRSPSPEGGFASSVSGSRSRSPRSRDFYSVVGPWPMVPNLSRQERGVSRKFLRPDRKGGIVF